MKLSKETEKMALDDFVGQTIQRNARLIEEQAASKQAAPQYPAVYIPDYTAEFMEINVQLSKLNQNYDQDNIGKLFNQMDKKIDAMPDIIPVRHHLDPKSKWVLIVYFMLIVLVAVLTGTTIGYYTETWLLKKQLAAEQTTTEASKSVETPPVKPAPKKQKHAFKNERHKQLIIHPNL